MGITQEGYMAVIHTTGNQNCCLVLRGGTSPNYERPPVYSDYASTNVYTVCVAFLHTDI